MNQPLKITHFAWFYSLWDLSNSIYLFLSLLIFRVCIVESKLVYLAIFSNMAYYKSPPPPLLSFPPSFGIIKKLFAAIFPSFFHQKSPLDLCLSKKVKTRYFVCSPTLFTWHDLDDGLVLLGRRILTISKFLDGKEIPHMAKVVDAWVNFIIRTK